MSHSGQAVSRRHATRGRSRFAPSMTCLEERIVLSTIPPGDPSGGGGGTLPSFGGGIGYSFSNWPAAELQGWSYTALNTQPIVGPNGQSITADDWVVRDPYPVSNLDGSLARIGDYYIMAGLSTPRNDAIGTLRWVNYIISKDGVNWQEGGSIISTEMPGVAGDQIFSGDLRYDEANNRLLIYYTAVTGSGPAEYPGSPSGFQIPQEIAISEATPVVTANGLTFTNYVHHGIELVPDGKWYAKPEAANTETEVYGFRDPWIFQDPESGRTFMLFVGNWGSDQTIGYPADPDGKNLTGDEAFPNAGPANVVEGIPRNDGVAGIAVATDSSLLNWELLPPLFGAISVNSQVELPHFVYQDGKYYLFVITHDRTFVDELKYDYPEGLYGFVAEDLTGPYRPLNGTGLVIANPPEDSLQNYGWKVVPTADGYAEVVSFINKGNSSTISPALKLKIEGDTAVIAGLQPPTGVVSTPDPALPLWFGITPTAARNSVAPAVSGSLESSSDSGEEGDSITNDATPTFRGKAPAGSIVRLIVQPEGMTSRLSAGQTTAGGDGTWTIISSPLPDGTHGIVLTADGGPTATTTVTSDLGTLTVDTRAPVISGLSIDPRNGRLLLSLQDEGGIDDDVFDEHLIFSVRRYLGTRSSAIRVSGIDASAPAGEDRTRLVALNLRNGLPLHAGRYGLTIGEGILEDSAGNTLAGYESRWLVRGNRATQPQEVDGARAGNAVFPTATPVRTGLGRLLAWNRLRLLSFGARR